MLARIIRAACSLLQRFYGVVLDRLTRNLTCGRQVDRHGVFNGSLKSATEGTETIAENREKRTFVDTRHFSPSLFLTFYSEMRVSWIPFQPTLQEIFLSRGSIKSLQVQNTSVNVRCDIRLPLTPFKESNSILNDNGSLLVQGIFRLFPKKWESWNVFGQSDIFHVNILNV